jgi:hypothetical protein
VTIKTQIISVVIFIVILIGIAVYVDVPGRGSRGVYGRGGNGYVMMGGDKTRHGMMNDYRSSDKHQYGLEAWDRSRQSPQEYNRNFSNLKEEIESLRNRSQEKRKELSSLLRSGKADKALIERKSEELEDLERYLDKKISSRNTQQ